MSTSLQTGIAEMGKETQAVLIFLADMPFVRVETIHAMANAFWKSQKTNTIVLPMYEGKRGHPVLLPRCYFEEIQKLQGDKGAREILQKHHEKICFIQSKTPEVLLDIDTKEEWFKWKNSLF
jgi:molybdenum cofactor cytidylyltransferase